jgi:Heterokaryon incompatibility protein (HET)
MDNSSSNQGAADCKGDEREESGVPKYVYQPLERQDTIRVMRLWNTIERIECRIEHIPFSKGGYQALSYVWGDDSRPFHAIVRDGDGQMLGYIPLTANLKNAICDLRDTKELKNQTFWIDQICINQDGEEKGNQVSLMSAIFKAAARVLTYLGPIESEIEERRGIQLLKQLDSHFSANYRMIWDAREIVIARQRRYELPVQDLPEELKEGQAELTFESQGWKWLLEMAFGDWTQRLWMVQEQLLNPEIVMLRGTQLISWKAVVGMSVLAMVGLFNYAHIELWQKSSGTHELDYLDRFHSTYNIWYHNNPTNFLSQHQHTQTLEVALITFERMKCRDPRDYIFSLLSISSDAEKLGITPNYSTTNTPASVFLETSIRTLTYSERLVILAIACSFDHPVDVGLPSWALNFLPSENPQPTKLLGNYFRPHPQNTVSDRPRFADSNTVLILKGRIVDKIRTKTSEMKRVSRDNTENDIEISAKAHARLLSCICEILSDAGVTIENTACLYRVITTGLSSESETVPERLALYFWSWYQFMHQYVNEAVATILAEMKESTNKSKFLDDMSRCAATRSVLIKMIAFLLSKASLNTFDEEDVINPDSPTRSIEDIIKRERSLFLCRLEQANQVGIENYDWFDDIPPEILTSVLKFSQSMLLPRRSLCITEQGRFCNAMRELEKGDAIAIFQGADRSYILREVGHQYRLIGDIFVDGIMFGEAYENVDPHVVDHDILLI